MMKRLGRADQGFVDINAQPSKRRSAQHMMIFFNTRLATEHNQRTFLLLCG
jgi:hypothetical protein